MKIGAIIAEYNPFHNGHQYQIEQFKKNCNLDYVVVIMSGDFTQRGEPACMNKHLRTQLALMGGADLVIELPAIYATGSAPQFAYGAIAHLARLNRIDALCFGCEVESNTEEHMKQLKVISDLLVNEPPKFKEVLNAQLKSGLSYPAAREAALQSILDIPDVFFEPNNILALEYIRSINILSTPITPVIISRQGESYHSTEENGSMISATAIRNMLNRNSELKDLPGISKPSVDLIHQHIKKSLPIVMNDFTGLFAAYLYHPNLCLTHYADLTKDIANRIEKFAGNYKDLDSFLMSLKNRSYTYSRLCRCITHILLNIKTEYVQAALSDKAAYYIRILGFKKSASPLLTELHKKSEIPLISKLADYKNQLSGLGLQLMESDLYASDLYRTVCQIKFQTIIKNEFSQPIIIL